MTAELIYVLGTALSWVGLGFLISAIVHLSAKQHLGFTPVAIRAGVGAAFLVVGGLFSHSISKDGGAFLPLTWVVMPFAGWVCTVSAVMVGTRSVQSITATAPEIKKARLTAAGIWAAVAALFAFLWFQKPDTGPYEPLKVLKGGIPMSWPIALGLLALVIAAVSAMAWSGTRLKSSGKSRAVVIQGMLILGTVIFGVPFLWLLITSFKEDRDMVSANGIIWVPRVQETVPYLNKEDPMYEGSFEGRTVRGTVISKEPDGRVQIQVDRPKSLLGLSYFARMNELKVVPRDAPVWTGKIGDVAVKGFVVREIEDGRKQLEILEPASMKGKVETFLPANLEPVRHIGLRTQNYSEALDYLPAETNNGLVYLKNTLVLVFFCVVGTLLSSSVVAYAFARMNFPGKRVLFNILLGTMMLPGAVTLLPKFLIFRSLGWIDSLYPLWVPAFFGSAFNIFLLRQFFMNVPNELEDAAKVDGCAPPKIFWSVMLPLVKPALAAISIFAFIGAWNNFIDPLIYVSTPEKMPVSYALQLFNGAKSGEPGLLMAAATLTIVPVLILFFFTQRYIVEGVSLSGLGGR
ncbi:MAG: carbohydrate ABC transporter permease [Armatimonadetes bacterium]|nr:carbohydrate ABC transporter permease [Armatimonadota bacterium]